MDYRQLPSTSFLLLRCGPSAPFYLRQRFRRDNN